MDIIVVNEGINVIGRILHKHFQRSDGADLAQTSMADILKMRS